MGDNFNICITQRLSHLIQPRELYLDMVVFSNSAQDCYLQNFFRTFYDVF